MPAIVADLTNTLSGTPDQVQDATCTLSSVVVQQSGDVYFYDSVDGGDVTPGVTAPILVVSRFCTPDGNPIAPAKNFSQGLYCIATSGAKVQVTTT